MKRYILYALFAILAIGFNSCLKSNLEELPAFEENDVTNVDRVEYRFISDEISKASNQKIVKFINLTVNKKEINKTDKTVRIEVTVPAANSDFPTVERDKVSKANLTVILSVSTAARVFPIGDAPRLGTPGDWTNPHKYKIEAANGNTAEWTVEVTNVTK
ncbi:MULTISPECIES: hypothetical protein [Capnocytophaga]|jgi:hypothetical protein|uniref:DUF5018-related domain-containing protein n=1 Tax=Capnocytophaga TaxID=1016 RepID=UPI000D03F282|nr:MULTISPECIES: hypothetical protein [Capnocytophaga]AVM56073.1 hypothetical protein C3V44_10970 [Capnocytophaga sp. oral taxon 864]